MKWRQGGLVGTPDASTTGDTPNKVKIIGEHRLKATGHRIGFQQAIVA